MQPEQRAEKFVVACAYEIEGSRRAGERNKRWISKQWT